MKNTINYQIGAKYRYPNQKKKFELLSVSENKCSFWFKCGHWCTDNVFIDLINVKTGVQVSNDKQLKLL